MSVGSATLTFAAAALPAIVAPAFPTMVVVVMVMMMVV